MVSIKFQIHGVKITGKYICESKKMNLATHAPQLSRFYYHQSRQEEITHFPKKKCFENLFFPSREGEDYGALHPTYAILKSLFLHFFSYFKIFHPSPLQNK